jgi:hypothetical protein
MAMLDIFRSDAFSLTSLTDAILKAPYKPSRIAQLGLFSDRGVTTTSIVVEEKSGRLALIKTTPRGAPAATIGSQKRTERSFKIPHLKEESTVLADEVQNVRAFGSESNAEAVQAVVNERLSDLRAMHEVTLEHMRAGAIQGLILDSDGSTLFNLFTEFGVVQQTSEIDLTGDIVNEIVAAKRLSENELGSEPVSTYRALCGDEFFDGFRAAAKVRDTYLAQQGVTLRQDLRGGFEFGGVIWENYRGATGGTAFIATDEAYLVPEGTNIFKTYFAPATYAETVNTIGLPMYAKIAIDPEFNEWAKITSQSNPLPLCLRPRAVVKLTLGT